MRARLAVAALAAAALAGLPASASATHARLEHVSTGPAGGNGAIAAAFVGSSADGTRAFFQTRERLVAADTDTATDVYERAGGATALVSVGSAGGNGTQDAFFSGASEDGAVVFFGTAERLEPADGDGSTDVYSRSNGVTSLVSTGSSGGNGAASAFFEDASADGSRAFFRTTEALELADLDASSDVYERTGGTTTLVTTGAAGGNGPFAAFLGGISDDGSRVFFETSEPLTTDDTDASQDVYERSGGTTTRRSRWGSDPISGNGAFDAFYDGNSGDGSRVWYSTAEALATSDGDTDSQFDVYERAGSSSTLISFKSGSGGGPHDAAFAGASGDGTLVFYETEEQITGADTDSARDVYRGLPAVQLMSTGPEGGNGAVDAFFDAASTDGQRVVFETEESLLAADGDEQLDLYERAAGGTTLLSQGPAGGDGAFDAFYAGASEDLERVFFHTDEALAGVDLDTTTDVYERTSTGTSAVSSGSGSFAAALAGASDDGAHVFFATREKLLSSDTDAVQDVYEAIAFSGFPRPQGAVNLRVPLVVAYEQCPSAAANRSHGPGLAFPSCEPPEQASDFATVGTRDSNGAEPNSNMALQMTVLPGDPDTEGDEADVRLSVTATDVRAKQSLSLADYGGELQALVSLRITDRSNAASPPSDPYDDAATISDLPFSFAVPCTPTADSEIGSFCSVSTTADGVVPGAVVEGKRALWEVGQIELLDGGPDGVASTYPNTVFARQGIFVP